MGGTQAPDPRSLLHSFAWQNQAVTFSVTSSVGLVFTVMVRSGVLQHVLATTVGGGWDRTNKLGVSCHDATPIPTPFVCNSVQIS